ncbi:hypothetical protein PT2222_10401 [Paraburkholderia tropica]
MRESAPVRNAGGLNPAHPVREEDEEEEGDREADARGERPDHALGAAPVVHHEVERRDHAGDDQRERNRDQDVHEVHGIWHD